MSKKSRHGFLACVCAFSFRGAGVCMLARLHVCIYVRVRVYVWCACVCMNVCVRVFSPREFPDFNTAMDEYNPRLMVRVSLYVLEELSKYTSFSFVSCVFVNKRYYSRQEMQKQEMALLKERAQALHKVCLLLALG